MAAVAADIKQVFEFLDKDKSGSIDQAELATGLRILGLNPTESEVGQLLENSDQNDDGKLSLQEFNNLFDECRNISSVNLDSVRQYFSQFDRDGSGFLDVDELKEALTNGGDALTESEAVTLFNDFDVNKDGKISLLEFVEALFT